MVDCIYAEQEAQLKDLGFIRFLVAQIIERLFPTTIVSASTGPSRCAQEAGVAVVPLQLMQATIDVALSHWSVSRPGPVSAWSQSSQIREAVSLRLTDPKSSPAGELGWIDGCMGERKGIRAAQLFC